MDENFKYGFREAFVFVLGCGNYVEKEALDLLSVSHSKIDQIVYGSTEIASPTNFISQLYELTNLNKNL